MIQVKDFSSRSDLEKEIISKNLKGVISGTREELARLGLSDMTILYDLKCVITDTPTQIKPQQERPQRGEVFVSKINGNIIK